MTIAHDPILVTGATGFVGMNVLEQLLAAGRHVVGYSSTEMPAPWLAHLRTHPGTLSHEVGDIRDAARLTMIMREHGVRSVLHLAAMTTGAGQEAARAADTVGINISGLVNVLGAAHAAGATRFVFAGSVAVFGSSVPDGTLLDEDSLRSPSTLYAITKMTGEQLTARLGDAFGLDWRIGRLGRVFGPYEYSSGVRDTLSQVYRVTAIARRFGHASLPRPCSKNWHYSRDAAGALVALLDHRAPAHHVYNLGTSQVWSLADWCERLRVRYPGFTYAVEAEQSSAGERIDLWGDNDGGLLSWQRARTDLDAGAGYTLDRAFDEYDSFIRESAMSGFAA